MDLAVNVRETDCQTCSKIRRYLLLAEYWANAGRREEDPVVGGARGWCRAGCNRDELNDRCIKRVQHIQKNFAHFLVLDHLIKIEPNLYKDQP